MAKISLKNFVDINIIPHVYNSINSTRDTVILFTADAGKEDKDAQKITLNSVEYNANLVNATNYNSIYEGKKDTLAYLNMYFNNGGVKALVINEVAYTDLNENIIKDLGNEYICISYATHIDTNSAEDDTTKVYSKLKTLAKNREESVYGIDEKIILANTKEFGDTDSVKNFAVKYSNQHGAEMTIAAYLSKINVYGINSIHDYAFTTENIEDESALTDEEYKTIIENNMNVDINLANDIRNCGGNCKDGYDLVNSYVRIILHQTLTDKLINLLSQKIKNSTGISKIYSTISQELENYVNSGYLTTDKIWTDETLSIVRNQVTYPIIEKGTPLINGYNVTVLPLSSLTQEEKNQHKAPPIYIVLATQYGIRHITINGEII